MIGMYYLSLFNSLEKKLDCLKMIASTPVEKLYELYQNDNSFKEAVFHDLLS